MQNIKREMERVAASSSFIEQIETVCYNFDRKQWKKIRVISRRYVSSLACSSQLFHQAGKYKIRHSASGNLECLQ